MWLHSKFYYMQIYSQGINYEFKKINLYVVAHLQAYFADVNRLLVDHSKLCHDSASSDGNGQQLSMDDVR